MTTITSYLTDDHKHCDALFLEAETAVSTGRWDQAGARLVQFRDALENHLAMEEQVLFIAFEKAVGSANGPTAIMRNEHAQMRGLLRRMEEALAEQDMNAYLGHSETMNIMMQQHNVKEESVLYLMTDRVLSGQASEVIDAMSEVTAMTQVHNRL